jgi:hypothetical protein
MNLNDPITDHIDRATLESTTITVSGRGAAEIAELLECCDTFLRQASAAVRAELRHHLNAQPSRPDTGWLIDMLGFTSLLLQNKIALAAEHAIRQAARPNAASTHDGDRA